jgi:hypothetical protein
MSEITYRPSAKVRLIVRFDEFGDTKVQAQSPKKPTPVIRGNKAQRAPLEVKPDTSVPNTRRFQLVPPGTSPAPGGPQAQSRSGDGYTFALAGIIPQSATWGQNGIRAADTLSLKLRAIDCPVDPETVRSCAVEYYLGTVTEDEYERGVAGQTRTAKGSDVHNYAEPLNLIPDQYKDASGRQRSNLRFQGFVDTWEVDWDGENPPVLTLECRDNTQLLIDTEAPSALSIALNLPIDRAIAQYLSNFPTFAGMDVEYRPITATPPTLSKVLAGTAYQPQLGPAPSKGGGAVTKLSVWDYLTDFCGAIGHIVRVEGIVIIIEQVVTLLSSGAQRRSDDPFEGRTVDGKFFPYRRFIWGKNLSKQSIKRSFARHQPPNIEVRSYSTRRKTDLVVRFPDPKDVKNLRANPRPGDGGVDQKWMVWKVHGIEDLATLHLVAQNVYQSVGRNELQREFSTKNLASYGGDNNDPDVLDMRAGDTFELLVKRDTQPVNQAPAAWGVGGDGTIAEIEAALLTRAQDFMEQLGFDPGFAAAYAKAYTNASFQTRFRLRQMSVDWDAVEEGVSISLVGANYIEVRVDKPFANPGQA